MGTWAVDAGNAGLGGDGLRGGAKGLGGELELQSSTLPYINAKDFLIAVAMEMRFRNITSFGQKKAEKTTSHHASQPTTPHYSLESPEPGASFYFTSTDTVPALSTKAMCAAAARHFDRHTNNTRVVNAKEIYSVLQTLGEERLTRREV